MSIGRMVFITITVVIIVLFTSLYISEYEKLLRIRSRAAWVEATINTLRKKNLELSKKLEMAKTRFFVEKVARESLGMSMPGEKVYYIIMKKK